MMALAPFLRGNTGATPKIKFREPREIKIRAEMPAASEFLAIWKIAAI